ncbi:MAG TPA: cytochrome c-type biogenesis protein [Burkholderiales bacterium]|nr:cytochrome c-type biogenesis protein [Burkholderiales bacterium]
MKAILFFFAVFLASTSLAQTGDPLLEARVMRIAAELRCLVCQNQSIADSHADLAVDLRTQIREQIQAGHSDEQIRSYMVERYGDFVLYRPPFKTSTVFLWVAPVVLFALGALILRRHLKSRAAAASPPLTDEQRARAADLLATNDE